MSLKKLVIFGTSEIAQLAFHYFSSDNKYKVFAFTVNSEYIRSETLLGLPVVPLEMLRQTYPPEETMIFVGMSYSNFNENRASVYNQLKSWHYEFANYINSKSSVFTENIGENVMIMDNVTVQKSVKIGNNIIIAPNVAICHDTIINDHNYIGPCACFCGYNQVDEYCIIGASSTVAPRVKIGKHNFIGVGSCIFNNTSENEAYINSTTPKSKLTASQILKIGQLKGYY